MPLPEAVPSEAGAVPDSTLLRDLLPPGTIAEPSAEPSAAGTMTRRATAEIDERSRSRAPPPRPSLDSARE
eukprot:14307168-Alexandrium_andersonii.AAC.1